MQEQTPVLLSQTQDTSKPVISAENDGAFRFPLLFAKTRALLSPFAQLEEVGSGCLFFAWSFVLSFNFLLSLAFAESSLFSTPLRFFNADAFLLSVNGIQKTSSFDPRRGLQDLHSSLSGIGPLLDTGDPSGRESPHKEHCPEVRASKFPRSM